MDHIVLTKANKHAHGKKTLKDHPDQMKSWNQHNKKTISVHAQLVGSHLNLPPQEAVVAPEPFALQPFLLHAEIGPVQTKSDKCIHMCCHNMSQPHQVYLCRKNWKTPVWPLDSAQTPKYKHSGTVWVRQGRAGSTLSMHLCVFDPTETWMDCLVLFSIHRVMWQNDLPIAPLAAAFPLHLWPPMQR